MDKLLEFLSHNVIEEKMYWRVAQLYTERAYEVQWNRDNAEPWKLRPVNDGEWQTCKTQDLTGLLNQERLDLVSFEEQVRSSLLQQIVFAHSIVKSGREFFGGGIVDAAIKNNEAFVNELKNAIFAVLDKEKAPTPKPKSTMRPKVKKSGPARRNPRSGWNAPREVNFLRLLGDENSPTDTAE